MFGKCSSAEKGGFIALSCPSSPSIEQELRMPPQDRWLARMTDFAISYASPGVGPLSRSAQASAPVQHPVCVGRSGWARCRGKWKIAISQKLGNEVSPPPFSPHPNVDEQVDPGRGHRPEVLVLLRLTRPPCRSLRRQKRGCPSFGDVLDLGGRLVSILSASVSSVTCRSTNSRRKSHQQYTYLAA